MQLLHTAIINLDFLLRSVSRLDINCPGDIIQYRCSVQSISEAVQLTWLVTFPGHDAIIIHYTSASDQNYTDTAITSALTEFRMDEFLQSDIELRVLQNISMNRTILECRSEDLASESIVVIVNASGEYIRWSFMETMVIYYYSALYTSWFGIAMEYYTDLNVTVQFEWNEPQGAGPQTVVDSYNVTITSSSSTENFLLSNQTFALNFTLNYNTNYTATISAENCIGVSEVFVHPRIEYGTVHIISY